MAISIFEKRLNELPINHLLLKGYDVFNDVFFVDEWDGFSNDSNLVGRMTFDSFASFYQYVKTHIYDDNDTCLYGYKISELDKRKFRIYEGKINFTSFTSRKLSDYTYEKIRIGKMAKSSIPAIDARSMKSFLKNCKMPKTYRDLRKQIACFEKL